MLTDGIDRLCLPAAVLQLAWRPSSVVTAEHELAIAGADSSLRVYVLDGAWLAATNG